MSRRMFPVLMSHDERRLHPKAPTSIPWSLIEPHRGAATANHYQTLEGLAERGGLGFAELVAVLNNQPFACMAVERAIDQVVAAVELFELHNEQKAFAFDALDLTRLQDFATRQGCPYGEKLLPWLLQWAERAERAIAGALAAARDSIPRDRIDTRNAAERAAALIAEDGQGTPRA